MNRGNDPSANMKENIMSDTNQNRPSHRLFTVNGEGDNARWTDIGVAWATRDGKGFTLNLNALPLNGRVVMRINDAKDEKKGRRQRPFTVPMGMDRVSRFRRGSSREAIAPMRGRIWWLHGLCFPPEQNGRSPGRA